MGKRNKMKNKIMNFSEMDELAIKISQFLEKGGVLGLVGDLGTGKTTFTKKICGYYGVSENVKSPTFTYVIEYKSGRKNIYHFDAYRMENSEDIYEIGFDDYIGEENAIIIVEWANNIEDEMPYDTIFIKIEYHGENSRKISIYKKEKGEEKYVDLWDNYFN